MLRYRQFAQRVCIHSTVHHQYEFTFVVVNHVGKVTKAYFFVRLGQFLDEATLAVTQSLTQIRHVFFDVVNGHVEDCNPHRAVK